jgi:hypothetical protein
MGGLNMEKARKGQTAMNTGSKRARRLAGENERILFWGLAAFYAPGENAEP